MFPSRFNARKVVVHGATFVLTVVVAFGWQGPSEVLAHGVVDQQLETNDHFSQINFFEPIGQEFTPAATTVIAVDVSLGTINEAGSADVTLLLRSDTIGGAVLASATRTLPQGDPGVFSWIHYELPTVVSLTPGQTYVIELESTNTTHAWSNDEPGDYEGGSGIEDGAPSKSGKDFGFRTYGEEAASIKGDVDCSGGLDAIDALKILRHNVGLPVIQSEPCIDIGDPS